MNRTAVITFGVLLAGWGAARLTAGEYPLEYPCCRLEQAPHLDGRADDAAWQQVLAVSGFRVLSTDRRAAVKTTSFKAGWTPEALYIAVTCHEEAPGKLRADAQDNGQVWLDDSVELFFQRPGSGESYRQFVANSTGARCIPVGPSPSARAGDWEAKAAVGVADWTLEVKIPFSLLGAAPRENEYWLVNVARNTDNGPPEEHYTCWPPLQGGFNDVLNFGRFVFRSETAGPAVYRRFLAEAVRRETEPLRANRGAILEAAEKPGTRSDAGRLAEVLRRSDELLSRPDAAPAELEQFVDQNRALGRQWETLQGRIQMETLFN